VGDSVTLGEVATNTVENLACRIAEQTGGKISPVHLVPYLPLSVGALRDCLDGMVQDSSAIADEEDGMTYYELPAYKKDVTRRPGAIEFSSCVSCGAEFSGSDHGPMCRECTPKFRHDLNSLADRTAWPAQAVYEHEILYLAANTPEPHRAESLAARSRFTIRNMQRKLASMVVERFIVQDLGDDGLISYRFPDVPYTREQYRRNREIIHEYPASAQEEMELKFVRIVLSLAALLLVLFGLAFLHIPFPGLILTFVIASPIIALAIWRHRTGLEES